MVSLPSDKENELGIVNKNLQVDSSRKNTNNQFDSKSYHAQSIPERQNQEDEQDSWMNVYSYQERRNQVDSVRQI
jgi:hypothetical protein